MDRLIARASDATLRRLRVARFQMTFDAVRRTAIKKGRHVFLNCVNALKMDDIILEMISKEVLFRVSVSYLGFSQLILKNYVIN